MLQEDVEDKKAITALEAQEAIAKYIASQFDANVTDKLVHNYHDFRLEILAGSLHQQKILTVRHTMIEVI